jgi:hypothetical protein
MAVTYTAASSITGHSCSQMPQPMQSSGRSLASVKCRRMAAFRRIQGLFRLSYVDTNGTVHMLTVLSNS